MSIQNFTQGRSLKTEQGSTMPPAGPSKGFTIWTTIATLAIGFIGAFLAFLQVQQGVQQKDQPPPSAPTVVIIDRQPPATTPQPVPKKPDSASPSPGPRRHEYPKPPKTVEEESVFTTINRNSP